jgi:hypothetical protein
MWEEYSNDRYLLKRNNRPIRSSPYNNLGDFSTKKTKMLSRWFKTPLI